MHPGPATDSDGVLREMLESGMNVARFNFSHGSHEEHKRRLDALKALREELGLPVAAMLDTKGPEVRLRSFADGAVALKTGGEFTLTTRTWRATSASAPSPTRTCPGREAGQHHPAG